MKIILHSPKLLAYLGWLFFVAGCCIRIATQIGWFANIPWAPFSGICAIFLGLALRWIAGFDSIRELEDGLRTKIDEVSKQEKEQAFRLQSGYSPMQTIFMVVLFVVVVVSFILFLQGL